MKVTHDGMRLWWLVRENSATSCYVLSAYVSVVRDPGESKGDQPIFESTIAGLEDRLFASGETAAEAEQEAMRLLHDLFEDALETDTLKQSFAGAKGLGVKLAKVSFNQMVESLKSVTKITAEAEAEARPTIEDQKWVAEPATDLAEVCS